MQNDRVLTLKEVVKSVIMCCKTVKWMWWTPLAMTRCLWQVQRQLTCFCTLWWVVSEVSIVYQYMFCSLPTSLIIAYATLVSLALDPSSSVTRNQTANQQNNLCFSLELTVNHIYVQQKFAAEVSLFWVFRLGNAIGYRHVILYYNMNTSVWIHHHH